MEPQTIEPPTIESHTMTLQSWAGIAAIVVLGGAGIYGYHDLSGRYTVLADENSSLTTKNTELSDNLYKAQEALLQVQARLGGFENTVGGISSTVGVLQKLSQTDRELLQKYSKVFFLNEHYAPAELVAIDQAYAYSNSGAERLVPQVWTHMKGMIDAAKADGITIYVKSAFRSFEEQKALKSAYTVTYGAGTANTFSADQGYSEHQLGTTADLISTGQGGALDGFDNTKAYKWMQDNAYKYGFILSYPKGNGYYVFEPWHWRFVGIKLATYLHEQGKNFYELEQRQIDEYLPDLFD